MTPGRALLFGLLLAAAPVRAAEPTIQFTGILTADGKTRLALTDTATDTTHWVEPGDEFKGYAIARYDAAAEAVFVRKSGQEHRLPLASPQHRPAVAAAAVVPAAAASEATQRAIRSNLRAHAAAARQYQLERGTASVAFADLVGPGKFIGELKPVAGENYSTLNISPDVTAISVTTSEGATVAIDFSTGLAQAPKPPTPSPPVAPTPLPALDQPPAATASLSVPATAPAMASAPPPKPEALPPTGREPLSPTYQIQGNDTWQKIAEATGVAVTELQRLNPTVNGSSLPAGQTIRIK